MKRAGWIMILILIEAGAPSWSRAAGGPGFSGEVVSGVVYVERGRKELKLDVYAPPGAAGAPVVAAIHGGGFIGGNRGLMDPLCRELAARGLVVFNLDYRLAPKDKFPAPIEDARCALRWIAAHASEYGGDPARLGITGESAGAYLAAMCVFPGPDEYGREPCPAGTGLAPAVKALVLYYGPYDLAKAYDLDWRPIPLLFKLAIGATPDDAPELYRKFSPSEYVRPGLPPALLLSGTRDYFLPEARDLDQRLRQAGNPVELEVYEGAKHGFAVYRGYGPWEEHTRRAAEFFLEHL